MLRFVPRVLLLIGVASLWACQSPTSPSDVANYADAVDVSFSPNPVIAAASTGKVYRVPRNNEPDEIREYGWRTSFAMSVSLNSNATSRDIDLRFPVKVTAVALVVNQASGGIVTPPSGGTERFEFVTLQSTGNEFPAVHTPIDLTFEVWYDLPSLRKEALITVNLTFVDNDGVSFSKSDQVRVAP